MLDIHLLDGKLLFLHGVLQMHHCLLQCIVLAYLLCADVVCLENTRASAFPEVILVTVYV